MEVAPHCEAVVGGVYDVGVLGSLRLVAMMCHRHRPVCAPPPTAAAKRQRPNDFDGGAAAIAGCVEENGTLAMTLWGIGPKSKTNMSASLDPCLKRRAQAGSVSVTIWVRDPWRTGA